MQVVLGAAEIRVFVRDGQSAFAAPNLIYHYVQDHHYEPPAEFLDALESGSQPGSEEYREMLTRTRAHWVNTEPGGVAFRFVKRPDGEVVREWVLAPKE